MAENNETEIKSIAINKKGRVSIHWTQANPHKPDEADAMSLSSMDPPIGSFTKAWGRLRPVVFALKRHWR